MTIIAFRNKTLISDRCVLRNIGESDTRIKSIEKKLFTMDNYVAYTSCGENISSEDRARFEEQLCELLDDFYEPNTTPDGIKASCGLWRDFVRSWCLNRRKAYAITHDHFFVFEMDFKLSTFPSEKRLTASHISGEYEFGSGEVQFAQAWRIYGDIEKAIKAAAAVNPTISKEFDFVCMKDLSKYVPSQTKKRVEGSEIVVGCSTSPVAITISGLLPFKN